MQTSEARDYTIVAQGFGFVEGPRGGAGGETWFSDLTGNAAFVVTPGGEPAKAIERQWVGGIVRDESGRMLISGRGGIVALDPATGATTPVFDTLDGEPVIAVNDMEADGRGGLFFGTIDFVAIMEKGTAPAPGALVHMAADGTVTVLRRDVFASNGIGFSPCGRWLYHSETSKGVWRYPLGPDGMPGEGTLVVALEDSDGLVTDTAGGFWVACWNTGRLLHFDAEAAYTHGFTFPWPHIVSLAADPADPRQMLVSTGGNAEKPGGAVLRMAVDTPLVADHATRLVCLEVPA